MFEVTKIIQDNLPVDDKTKVDTLDTKREVKSASDFNEEISGTKGIDSKWCYCPKFEYGLDGEVRTSKPSLIVVGDEYIHLEKK